MLNISESILAALFCFSMVFVLLAGLFILVRLSTSIIRRIEIRMRK